MTGAVPSAAFDSGTTRSGVYYEVHGRGPALCLGFPVFASHAVPPANGGPTVVSRFLAQLTDRYRVVVADYPAIGRSGAIPPKEFTAERVCADMLGVADAAGLTHFAWWGGTFGAVTGLLLASRTDRVSALVCAGWPPLGAPYQTILRGTRQGVAAPPPNAMQILRTPGQYAQWVHFYESLSDWSELDAVRGISCPRLIAFGERGDSSVADLPLPLASVIRARRAEFETLGWEVHEIPGRDMGVILDPDALVPVVRPFLDRVL
jgi:pimeloyl-ACP methyl ester carboxylesterase